MFPPSMNSAFAIDVRGVTKKFGDRVVESPHGPQFVHIPSREEVLADLAAAGWRYEVDATATFLALENDAAREFAGDSRFWIAQNPEKI